MSIDSQTEAKAKAVRDMFSAIAHRYDFLNHFLSLNVDRRWRKACVRALRRKLGGARGATTGRVRILDIGCGTGDLSLELSALGSVTGCDFAHPMLCIGSRKVHRGTRGYPVALLEADALCLPFGDASFDA